jgi:hypothetical protein
MVVVSKQSSIVGGLFSKLYLKLMAARYSPGDIQSSCQPSLSNSTREQECLGSVRPFMVRGPMFRVQREGWSFRKATEPWCGEFRRICLSSMLIGKWKERGCKAGGQRMEPVPHPSATAVILSFRPVSLPSLPYVIVILARP